MTSKMLDFVDKECRKIILDYYKYKNYRKLYEKYSPYKVGKCINLRELTILLLQNIDRLNDTELDMLQFFIVRNKDLKLNNKLLPKVLHKLRDIGLHDALQLAGFILISQKLSRNIRYKDLPFLKKVIKKEYSNNIVRVSLTKPELKSLISLMIYLIVITQNEEYLDLFLKGTIDRGRKDYLPLLKNIMNISYIPYKNEFINTLIDRLDKNIKIKIA